MKNLKMLFALVLVAAFAAMSFAGPAHVALADKGSVKGHTFDVTFTKWVTSTTTAGAPLNMAGVVGGDVGAGTFAGEVLSLAPGVNITTIHALYHMNGSRHSFTADNVVTQDNVAGTATITGVVTQGWLKGWHLTGEYTVFSTCPMATPGNVFGSLCFQGTLHVHVGAE